MPAYDAIRFTPPAPLALVTFRNIATGARASNVPMLLDSGADVSLAPRQSVLPLGVSIDTTAVYELMEFDGNRSLAQAVHLDLVFLGEPSEADSCWAIRNAAFWAATFSIIFRCCSTDRI